MFSEEIIDKANQCFGCSNPHCVKGCPLNMNIPTIIKNVKDGDLESAYREILNKSYLGSICGRVCSHGMQCEGECVRGISSKSVSIGEIEQFVCDWGIENIKEEMPKITKEKIAIIGSGPAGLTCAIELRKKGFDITIFERENVLGGILRYIPEYRLEDNIVNKVIDNILQYDINVKINHTFGIDFTIDDLKSQGFKAIFIGMGNDMSKRLKIRGMELNGVYWANDFLREIEYIKFKNVVVVGGGNVAMDACRMAKLKGAKNVTVLYRKERKMMKASKEEVEQAEKDGVNFRFETLPTEILGDEEVEKVICNDGDTIKADLVIMAIGALPNYSIIPDEIKLSDDSLIAVNEYGETSVDGVFAGGDVTQKKATVCNAILSAHYAAEGIDKKLRTL